MGKRSRRRKGETLVDSNLAHVRDKSPKMNNEKLHFPENDIKDSSAIGDTPSKITDYFPKSPEGRTHRVDCSSKFVDDPPPKIDRNQELATSILRSPLNLLTPDTTPIKDPAQPRSLPLSCNPKKELPLQEQATPLSQDACPRQESLGSTRQPKALQRLDYDGVVGNDDDSQVGKHLEPSVPDKKGDKKMQGVKSKPRRRKSRQPKPEVQSPIATLKDYFPVRRSNRRCKSSIKTEEAIRLQEAVLLGKEDGVRVDNIPGKGRGVLATRAFNKGDFVVEYHGEHIDTKVAKSRELDYTANPDIGCYMYYYQYKNKSYCVDATQESGRTGRLLNHSKSGNCTTKLIGINGVPYLILVAATSIAEGEELLYDYGDRNKESIESHPWLAL